MPEVDSPAAESTRIGQGRQSQENEALYASASLSMVLVRRTEEKECKVWAMVLIT